MNKFPETSKREELSVQVMVKDHAKDSHLLPQFLSKVASPDSNNFAIKEEDDSFLSRFE